MGALLFSLPGLLPAVWAGLARLEGSHGVEMGRQGDDIRVVLTHPSSCARTPALYRHGPLVRFLTIAALPNATRDHQLNFICATNWLAEENPTGLAGQGPGSPRLIAIWELGRPCSPLPGNVIRRGRNLPRPFPAWTGIATTRLLI